MRLKVIKRNGEEVSFEISKIKNAITKANHEIPKIHQLNSYQIDAIANTIEKQLLELPHAANVEDIQDMVEKGIMEMRGYEVAQKYVRYRFKRELARKANTTDNGILSLIDRMNEEVKQEKGAPNNLTSERTESYTERILPRTAFRSVFRISLPLVYLKGLWTIPWESETAGTKS